MSKSRSLTDDQHAWYVTQPVEYRRAWWDWAIKEHNFDRMVAEFVEEDESVIRFRKLAVEKRRELDVQAVRAKEEQGERVF